MLTLVHRARQRLFHNELFGQAAYAGMAILAAFILLLLAGTGLLDWRWMALVSIAAAAAAIYRARKRRPTPYAAAQVVDRRLSLADTISTAVYFQQAPDGRNSADLRQYQLRRADELSQNVDVRQAIPYAMPRGIYLLAVLFLVAGSLFALRYGLLGHLDLKPPLAHVLRDQLGWKQPQDMARNAKRPPRAPEQRDEANGVNNDPDVNKATQPDSNGDSSDMGDDSSADKADASKADAKQDGNRSGKAGSEEQNAQAEGSQSQSQEKSGDQNAKQDSKQQGGEKEQNGNNGENSSLMNKAKDMLQNLLSSLKPPSSNPGSQQQNNDSNKQNSPQKQNEKSNQAQNKGEKSDSQQGEQGEPSPDQQAESQQANSKNDPQQATKQPGSGAGNQDGDKRIKQAADLAAMGKITEILGKRSATLTGEATVEVQATSQQLKTAYAPGAAQHGESSGEINRDEVPVAMQPYVQEYFKQARKPDATPAPSTGDRTKKQ